MARISAVLRALLLLGGALAVRHRDSRHLGSLSTAKTTCAEIGCFAAYNKSAPCQCNRRCSRYKNCCSDFSTTCFAQATCADIGCGAAYNASRSCQCNDRCPQYGNCCSDYDTCATPSPPSAPPRPSPSPPSPPSPSPPSPSPTPIGVGAEAYWAATDTMNMSAVIQRLRSGHKRLSYSKLWAFYRSAWVNLPGQCQGSMYDIYSKKCWRGQQCGAYQKEGDCYNREHSWPKSWWGGAKNDAYSDVFHVMPSDGYVNGRRGSYPFGEVNSPKYTSSEGHKLGRCSTPGYSGTCFEPTDRTKGVVARGYMYVSTRYAGLLSGSSDAVDGASMKGWTKDLMLSWHAAHPPENWEREWNSRAQIWQGNRNPYIDFPELAQRFHR